MARHPLWSDAAKAELRAIDRETALRLLKALARFLQTDQGDVKPLKGSDPTLFRLRVGGWRIMYEERGSKTVEVMRLRKRGEAYR